MNSDKQQMEKKEMKNIHAGAEKTGSAKGIPGRQQGSSCALAVGSCCRRTENCSTHSR